jgi:hypothetical protein
MLGSGLTGRQGFQIESFSGLTELFFNSGTDPNVEIITRSI